MDPWEDPDFHDLQVRWETSPKLAWQSPEVGLHPPPSSSGEGPPPGSPPSGPSSGAAARPGRLLARPTLVTRWLILAQGSGRHGLRHFTVPSPRRGLDRGWGEVFRSVDTVSNQLLSYSSLIDFLLVF